MQGAYELAAKIFQFHRKTNILHSVFTLKSRIQDIPINRGALAQQYSPVYIKALRPKAVAHAWFRLITILSITICNGLSTDKQRPECLNVDQWLMLNSA
ncbi:MAG: hypothetical protein OFPII_43040 [Osedax symbiont Rs1]|nr:MAG: hypothetical protein OFPII_43040 [Osedax symbiont Rs1]